MAKRIIWTNKAHQNRIEILQYWQDRNKSNLYNKKLNGLIKKALALVAAHPHIGRKTSIENVRVKLVRDYLIFYKEEAEVIFVLAIWDNRQNPDITTF